MRRLAYLFLLIVAPAAPASASELFGGVFAHDVKTPLNLSGVEEGVDLQLGWRGGGIARTPLQPYVFASINSSGETNFAAAGLSAKFGSRLYVRPGLGIAVHTGSSADFETDPDELEFGSRVLFEPEISVGTRIGERLSVEATWVHFSHARVFGQQNPGIDNIGVRLNLDLP